MNWINKVRSIGEKIKKNIKKNFRRNLKETVVIGPVAVVDQS